MALKKPPEYKKYEFLEHWKPINEILPPEKLFNPKNKLFPLFKHIYILTKKVCEELPLRKNEEVAFIHPINVTLTLKEAGVKDEIVLCAGMAHDFVEEKVDIYKNRKKIIRNTAGIKKLDKYEGVVFRKLEKNFVSFCKKNKIEEKNAKKIIATIKLLTRHKRDFYYRSMSNIFNSNEAKTKQRAMQVKLADRTHNILCIECFNEQQRIYQCFKNLFILNNTKKYLLEKRGKKLFQENGFPLELLFKRCAKATYDSFLNVCHISSARGITNIKSMLQLAFKKFALEKAGMWEVTEFDKDELHLMRLYYGIIRKNDARLRHRWDQFKQINEDERKYCQLFFKSFNFNQEQIQAIINYKDAYALKEIVANLLYLPEYTISKFSYVDLFAKKQTH